MDSKTVAELKQIEAQLQQHQLGWLKGGVPYEAYAANCQPLTNRQLELWRAAEADTPTLTPLTAQAAYDLACDNPQAFADWQQSVAHAIES